MNQNPLISVIVPVYNVEAYLSRCVESIRNQTYQNLEIILVDDGTKDRCNVLCDEYALEDSRIRVIHKENGGLSSARNAGIDSAQGEYLAFVDSDDWIEPDTYEAMLAAAQKYGVKLVCAGRYDVDSKTDRKTLGLCPQKEESVSAKEVLRRIFTWDNMDSAAWDKLYDHSLFREIRFPLGKVCEDVPIMYRIVLDAGEVAMLNKPIYNYFHRPGSITTARISEKTFHFSEHTSVIYTYIREKYPDIAQEARYLRVRSLIYNLQMIALAGEEDKKQFAMQYGQSRKELRRHVLFVMSYPLFKNKDRITVLLHILGIYPLLRKIYHFLKRR